MKYTKEVENNVTRIVLDFVREEKPRVADVLRQLLSDYRRSFESIVFERDNNPYDGRDGYYAEFYIRNSDNDRLERLLGKAES